MTTTPSTQPDTDPQSVPTAAMVQRTQSADEPPRQSPWSLKAKIIRALWGISELILWRLSPPQMTAFRNAMLRFFGANIGKGVRIHPSVKVVIPWNIQIGDAVTIHERAILYALGPITIGNNTQIGPLTHLCAGTHDYTNPSFTLLRQPITIGNNCTLAAASFVAPNVTLADHTTLHPRAALYINSAPNTQYQGNPAKPIESP